MPVESILVTGAAGFTGRHLLAAARAEGHKCIALRRFPEELAPKADLGFACDLLDREALFDVIAVARPTIVIHLAAVSFVAHDNASEIYQINLLGTLNLLDAICRNAPKVKRVLLASSANIYGNARSLPIAEESLPEPMNHYGVSKYAMEMASRLYLSLPIIITRPFNYTGAGQAEHFLVPKIVSAYRAGKRRLMLGNLDVARDFSDVRDVVSAYLKLVTIEAPCTTYNVCSGRSVTLLSIIDYLAEIAGYRIEIEKDPELIRSNEILELRGSTERLDRTIGTYREFSMKDTLSWMLDA